jgi:cytoskeletal protein RodZ
MPSVATAIDVARLYDELRDCVRANDQEGVKRVFNELVRARRPVTEILDEVRSISKERERSEPERDVTPLREWPPRSAPVEAEPSTPGLTFRNFGPAAAPEPAPEPPQRAPEPAPRSPAIDPSFRSEDWDSVAASPESGREEALPSPDEEPRHAAPSEPIGQNAQPTVGSDVALEHSDPAAALQPQLEEGPTSPRLEEAIANPSYQSFDGTISSEPAVAVATGSEPERNTPPLDEAPQADLPTAVEEGAPEAALHLSSRAVSLGVELDAAPAAVDTAPPARRAPWARLGVALVFLIAIAGVGWFMLIRPPAEQVAVKPIPPSESVATAAGPTGSTGAAPAGQPVAAAVATPPAAERAPETAAPAPAAIPAARLPVAVPPAPGDIATTKPDATSAVAKLEMPKTASPSASASPDIPSPATPPTVVAPPAPTPPSEPRASAAETAALLARGDSLFGVGDVSSARLFYERAADAGNGEAALRLGETYDPVFLERAKLPAVRGDRGAAVFWYRRARELGVAEAEILLKGIQTK